MTLALSTALIIIIKCMKCSLIGLHGIVEYLDVLTKQRSLFHPKEFLYIYN